ncbi:MAG: hypothetical protein IE887_03490 [Campylobacterales bacterium]|nr:hypothetical protein [Campylobacterales bacterium]
MQTKSLQITEMKKELERYKQNDLSSTKDLLVSLNDFKIWIEKKLQK